MCKKLPLAFALTLVVFATDSVAEAQEWLSLCSKCPRPTITSKSGIGTSNAVADAVITHKEIQGWCENWEPGDVKGCFTLQQSDIGKKYRATADCARGRITTIDGESYTLAGVWVDDIGRGRTKWKNKSGQVVGQDNASNGLAISQQWEVLCPKLARKSPAQSRAVPKKAAKR